MPEYKVLKDGKEYTTPDIEILKRWLKERKIRASDQVYHPVLQKWLYVKDMAELEEEIKKLSPGETSAGWNALGCIWEGVALAVAIIGFIVMAFHKITGVTILIIALLIFIYGATMARRRTKK